MKDRFKFRLWDAETEQYHYNDFVVTATGYIAKTEVDTLEHTFIDQTDFTFDDKVLEQCAGLMDKNSKLIYEGDIIKAKDNLRWVVVFKNGCFFGKLGTRYEPVFDLVNYGFEVIGNIHENPELVNNETQAKQLYDNKIQAKEALNDCKRTN